MSVMKNKYSEEVTCRGIWQKRMFQTLSEVTRLARDDNPAMCRHGDGSAPEVTGDGVARCSGVSWAPAACHSVMARVRLALAQATGQRERERDR